MERLIIRITTGALALGLAAGHVFAQQRMVPISPTAKRADITFNGTPEILIDGKTARLAPGVRIYDRNNMMAISGALDGAAKAKYLVEETTGLVIGIWILTNAEIATPDPEAPK